MATRKDQLDAFVFARRRMVANLVAPSPTGSDEAAPRPVKTFVTSAILSAIAVAGVAVLGVFKPSAPNGWQSGLAVDSSSGAAYIYAQQDKQLHPILNITSARLLLGTSFKKFDVPDNVINGSNMTIGAPFGILGAPQDVPTAGSVDLTQWNLCLQSKSSENQTLAGGKTVLEIGYPAANESQVNQYTGFVVHDSGGVNYLITGDYAYPIADTNVLNALTSGSAGANGTEGPWVSSAWLKAFAPGTPLRFPTLTGIGDNLTGLSGQPGQHVGDYGTVTTVNGTVGYIETRTGLVSVNNFVYSLYVAGPQVSENNAKPMSLNISQVNLAQATNEQMDASRSFGHVAGDWPQNSVTTLDSDGVHPGFGAFCVSFDGTFDGNVPHLNLSYGTGLPQSLGSGGGIVQSGGTSLADVVLVKSGHAALARDVSGGDSQNTGPQYLVTDTGVRYPLAPGTSGQNGQNSQPSAVKMLQYDKLPVSPVPDSWMNLVQPGSLLDPQAAGQTPPITQQ
jgi:type VII secretion protein EccB